MLLTGSQTAVVTSTDLKRKYQEVIDLLEKNMMVIVTNRNNTESEADGILLPYSENLIKIIEDIVEDMEMNNNKDELIKEFDKSYKSGNKKRIPLSSVVKYV